MQLTEAMSTSTEQPIAPTARRSKSERAFYELRGIARQLHLLTEAAYNTGNTEEMADRIHDLMTFIERADAQIEAQHDGKPHDAENLQSVLMLVLPAVTGAAMAAYPDGADQVRPRVSWDSSRWLDAARTVSAIAEAVLAPRAIEEADALADQLVWLSGAKDGAA